MSKWKEFTDNEELLEETLEIDNVKPPMYNVLLLNDDYTPMDFVVEVLRIFFNMDSDKATDIMLDIHYKGKASCGTFTAEIAETKVSQVNGFSKENQHPLQCKMEKV